MSNINSLVGKKIYPARMFAVTVRPMRKGTNRQRVLSFTAPILTTIVRKSVITISATVATPTSALLLTAVNAAPDALLNSMGGEMA